jgi:DNA-directed RNA polymerase subunit RPC12/RpoP
MVSRSSAFLPLPHSALSALKGDKDAPLTTPRAQSPASSSPAAVGERRFPCAKCGAKLEFTPGTQMLSCVYCGHANEIPRDEDVAINEEDLGAYLARLAEAEPHAQATTATCTACNAETTIPPNVTSYACPFCGTNIVAQGRGCSVIRPRSLLPFKITREKADAMFRAWVKSRWFAPTKLKKQAMLDAALTGMYVPAWTFDSNVTTHYSGQRGDAYWETETYYANGQQQTRQVRKVRWSYASGTVHNAFDDLLVLASKSLPEEKAKALEPWDLEALVPYADDYLAGFTAERYQVELIDGFEHAKEQMVPAIRVAICADIGGDEQRISTMQSSYSHTTFKHILLPVWLSAYRFRGKIFRFLINARTGEVQGERPYSPWKIAFAIIAGLIAIGVLVYMISQR